MSSQYGELRPTSGPVHIVRIQVRVQKYWLESTRVYGRTRLLQRYYNSASYPQRDGKWILVVMLCGCGE